MSTEPGRRHYLAVFTISLSLLVLEIAVARVLSVALLSHYAFVAISLAMFGLGTSGLVVYLFPAHFTAEKLDDQLISYTSIFAATAALSLTLFLQFQVAQELSLRGFFTLGLAYALLTTPFFFGGICISLLMTHFSERMGRIYFADLIGASLGCLAVVGAMQLLPAPQVIVATGALVAATALLVAVQAGRSRRAPLLACGLVAVICALGATTNLLKMRYIKSWNYYYTEYEAWNAFSRVGVIPNERNAAQLLPLRRPASEYTSPDLPRAYYLDIDGSAWTPMMSYDGNPASNDFLLQSVLYIAHHVRPHTDALIVGTGGGRDILAAVAAGQRSVLGIELNPLMAHIVQDVYGDFSGRPYTLPGVHVLLDEARSRLSTLDKTFGIIQLSLIDTFSLNASGGFVFSENYLYTEEAFQEYFEHLRDDGVLSVTRYYNPNYPLETLRIVGMVRAAWEAEGVADARRHIAVLSQPNHATVLGKRAPFTDAEVALLRRVADEDNMQVLFLPGGGGASEEIEKLLDAPDLDAYAAAYPFLIKPPTDDRPFFFHFLRGRLAPQDIPDRKRDPFQFLRHWHEALWLLYMLIAVVSGMAVMFFFAPLLLARRRVRAEGGARVALPLLLYFGCLGYGFMMIEIPLLQRFMLLLGYPTYALAVVLFALLLSSGTGSLISTRFAAEPRPALVRILAGIVGLAGLYVFVIPPVITAALGASIYLRIALTVLLLAPVGVLLGMAYPLGIGVLRRFGEDLVPWAWGLNGALSVVASVLAIFIGSRYGFAFAFLTGVAAYALAFGVMALAPRRA